MSRSVRLSSSECENASQLVQCRIRGLIRSLFWLGCGSPMAAHEQSLESTSARAFQPCMVFKILGPLICRFSHVCADVFHLHRAVEAHLEFQKLSPSLRLRWSSAKTLCHSTFQVQQAESNEKLVESMGGVKAAARAPTCTVCVCVIVRS